ncbi:MAG: WD40/YVTN/BNR-like repeat-containing protein, partial [Bacteroidota bacterium]
MTPDIYSVTSAGGVLFAVGAEGTILRSQNNGDSWNIVQLPQDLQSASFHAIAFANASTGIIGGAVPNLAYTVDGGASFTKSDVPASVSGTIVDIQMFSDSHAIAVTNTEHVLATFDGGKTWISTAIANEELACATYSAENCMFVGGKNGVYKISVQNNMGLEVTPFIGNALDMNITSLMFNTCLYGYAFGSDGSVYKTEQGNVLEKQDEMSHQSEIVAVAPLSSNSFVLLGNNAEISFTEDNNGLYSSKFWYDKLGRLIASQNSKQFLQNTYSYTVYDEIGRIVEVGELSSDTPPPHNTLLTSQIDYTDFVDWIAQAPSRTQVTKTTYDRVLEGLAVDDFEQRNVRNRVTSIRY